MGDLFYLVQGKRAAQEGLFPVGEPLLDDLVAPDVIAQQETSNEMFQSSPGPKAGCFARPFQAGFYRVNRAFEGEPA